MTIAQVLQCKKSKSSNQNTSALYTTHNYCECQIKCHHAYRCIATRYWV